MLLHDLENECIRQSGFTNHNSNSGSVCCYILLLNYNYSSCLTLHTIALFWKWPQLLFLSAFRCVTMIKVQSKCWKWSHSIFDFKPSFESNKDQPVEFPQRWSAYCQKWIVMLWSRKEWSWGHSDCGFAVVSPVLTADVICSYFRWRTWNMGEVSCTSPCSNYLFFLHHLIKCNSPDTVRTNLLLLPDFHGNCGTQEKCIPFPSILQASNHQSCEMLE